MISLEGMFWIFVVLFGIVGGLRGWAKEILVTFSMILALFIQIIVETYLPGVRQALVSQSGLAQFLIKGGLFAALAFFGYQTPSIRRIGESGRFARDKLQDWLLGFILGLLNGYFLVGTLWSFMDTAGYPFRQISPPLAGSRDLAYLAYLPPRILGVPWIFFAIGAAFVFVIIVFI